MIATKLNPQHTFHWPLTTSHSWEIDLLKNSILQQTE